MPVPKIVFIGPEPRPELLSTGYMYSGILFYILVKYIGIVTWDTMEFCESQIAFHRRRIL